MLPSVSQSPSTGLRVPVELRSHQAITISNLWVLCHTSSRGLIYAGRVIMADPRRKDKKKVGIVTFLQEPKTGSKASVCRRDNLGR